MSAGAPQSAMDQADLAALLDRHGNDPAGWPVDQRGAAEALLAASASARAALRVAEQLDAALDAAFAAPPPPLGLRARIVAGVPARDAWLDWLASRLWRPVSLACAPLLLGFGVGVAAVQEAANGDGALEDRALVAFEADFADYELPEEANGS